MSWPGPRSQSRAHCDLAGQLSWAEGGQGSITGAQESCGPPDSLWAEFAALIWTNKEGVTGPPQALLGQLIFVSATYLKWRC